MAVNIGKNAKITVSGTTILYMDSFNFDQNWESMKVAVFGEDDKLTVGTSPVDRTGSAHGYFDPSDTDGQAVLETYFSSQTVIPGLRFYINSTNYYECGVGDDDGIRVTGLNVSATREGSVECDLSFDISGTFSMT